MKQGKLPIKDTGIGFWGAAHSDDLFLLFTKLQLGRFRHLLDLGSGDGKVVLLASLFTQATGIEFHAGLHKVAEAIHKKCSHLPLKGVRFLQGDFMQHPFSDYDVLFINPDKPMKVLEEKIKKEFHGLLVVHGAHFHPTSIPKKEKLDVNGTYITVYDL
ncbi:hypothetical protein HZB01_01580 [Candidatus Woesearchaeota archaeon]|nr:hypothetical protein [Candidatus Woesearchaeota archaeon]